MAPQHRRGGKHAVKDEDLTHTKYDDYNREQLLAAVKEAGCYVKDEKKSAMARRLADRDQNLQMEERRAMQERKENERRKEQEIKEAAKAKELRRQAREERNEDRWERRELGEDISSDSEDSEDLDERDRDDAHKLTVTGGEVLSDDSWEDTCSETSVCSVNPRIAPSCKLRLYEWSYPFAPSPDMPTDFTFELFPVPITYAPLRLTAMSTGEKVTLPGLKYPVGVEPDFVPVLDPIVRAAARHGHTIGLLAHATIERASTWAIRTIIHGWNGCMYFSLPSTISLDAELDEVYRKWNAKNTKLLQPTPGAANIKADRDNRFAQRLANKRRAVADAYEASQWQPHALGFMPAHLDWEPGMKDMYLQNDELMIDNLFYVRFPDCDLPHYCFWAMPGGWTDPTTPDPSWSPESTEHQNSIETAMSTSKFSVRSRLRVRNLTAPPAHSDHPLANNDPEATLPSLEHDLITTDLSTVLSKASAVAMVRGRSPAWNAFARQLPTLYPSSVMPRAPPVEPTPGMCVAEKLTALLFRRIFLPFTGQESWTRMDDEYWEVVSNHDDDAVDSPELHQSPHPHTDADTATKHEGMVQVLHRRNSDNSPPSPKDGRVWTWLARISATNPPRLAPVFPSNLTSPTALHEPISPLNLNSTTPPPTCHFCNIDWSWTSESDKAAHMLSHSYTSTPPTAMLSQIQAVGVCAKRRHSLLSVKTLTSYHNNLGKGRKLLRVDSASRLIEELAKVGTVASPFTQERWRVRKKGEFRRVLEKRMSGMWQGFEASGWQADDERVK
ncbi:hypothetical protein B5807_11747 [Epicoccum nigrum]|uniref:Uncharacterized protein n=1 Tax=Epicoccum nigrum TaxID=105696 RepID=A0A1Y2LIK3_EPING|nr:hypothetical protein B5807_11747 [Epicoccum nigrum]